MLPLVFSAALLGQYSTGYVAGAAHVAHGYCGQHQVYHQQAVFAADPYHLTAAVASYIRQQAADAAREQANRDLSAKLDRIEATLKAQTVNPAMQTVNPAISQGDIIPPPPTPAEVAAAPLATALQRCATCHTGDASSGAVVIFDAPGKLATLDLPTKVAINEAMKSGKMPPKGPKPTAEDRKPIVASIQDDLSAIASTLKD